MPFSLPLPLDFNPRGEVTSERDAHLLVVPPPGGAKTPAWLDDPNCQNWERDTPFRRLIVDYFTEGASRITWELDRHFVDDGPYVYQLQYSHGGVPTADDWEDVGPPQVDAMLLTDGTKRLYGASATVTYRVQLTTADGSYNSPIAGVLGRLSKHDWLKAREIIRKERLRMRIGAGTKGFLLKARRFGEPCSCIDSVTGEVTDSNCEDCFGVGITGGYYPAVPCWYSDPINESTREHRDTTMLGTVKNTVVEGRFSAEFHLIQGDAWVNESSDERYYIHPTKELSCVRGVPVIFGVELRLAPRTDVLYTVPVST